jgi:hypothetical protein
MTEPRTPERDPFLDLDGDKEAQRAEARAGLDFAKLYRIMLGMPLGLSIRKRAEYIIERYAALTRSKP